MRFALYLPPVRITLNGEPHDLAPGATIVSLIEELRLKPRRFAIEVNRQIIPHEAHATTSIHDGDQVEVIHFVGGG